MTEFTNAVIENKMLKIKAEISKKYLLIRQLGKEVYEKKCEYENLRVLKLNRYTFLIKEKNVMQFIDKSELPENVLKIDCEYENYYVLLEKVEVHKKNIGVQKELKELQAKIFLAVEDENFSLAKELVEEKNELEKNSQKVEEVLGKPVKNNRECLAIIAEHRKKIFNKSVR